MEKNIKLVSIVVLVGVSMVLVGCAKKHQELEIAPQYDQGPGTRTPESTSTGEGLPEVDVERLTWEPMGLEPIYFDFDKYDLRPDARETLKQHSARLSQLIKETPSVLFQIEGHCDERGTQEYNMALGARRALAAREYLMMLGVPADRLLTISYGEEFPADPGHDEVAWAKNRRCEFSRAREPHP